jgi:membrane associated rhomboid family serine protease
MPETDPIPHSIPRPRAPRQLPPTPATWLILAINTVVFLVAEASGGTTHIATLIRFGASERSLIWAGEYWRFVTPMFLHIGWMHFVWNGLMMLPLCLRTERELGSFRFVLAYLATGVGATATSLLFHDVVSAGASGAGFGLIGISLVLDYRKLGGLKPFLEHPAMRQNLILIAIWVGLGFMSNWMDNYAHLGGLFFGLLLGALLTSAPAAFGAWGLTLRAGFALLLGATVVAAAVPRPDTSLARTTHAWNMGIRAMEAKDYPAAIQAFDEAEAGGLKTWELYYNRALARDQQALGQPQGPARDDLKLALADADRAVFHGGNAPEPYMLRGHLRWMTNDLDGAEADFKKSLELAPTDWPQRAAVEDELQALRAARR